MYLSLSSCLLFVISISVFYNYYLHGLIIQIFIRNMTKWKSWIDLQNLQILIKVYFSFVFWTYLPKLLLDLYLLPFMIVRFFTPSSLIGLMSCHPFFYIYAFSLIRITRFLIVYKLISRSSSLLFITPSSSPF